MAQQENINVQYGAQREHELVSADLTLDKFDTGKLLVVSSSQATNEAGALTCSFPAASAVEAGFSCTILLTSEHSHSIQFPAASIRGALNSTVILEDVTAGSAPNGLIKWGSNLQGPAVGAQLQVWCDGNLWIILGTGPGQPVQS